MALQRDPERVSTIAIDHKYIDEDFEHVGEEGFVGIVKAERAGFLADRGLTLPRLMQDHGIMLNSIGHGKLSINGEVREGDLVEVSSKIVQVQHKIIFFDHSMAKNSQIVCEEKAERVIVREVGIGWITPPQWLLKDLLR